MGVQLFRYGLFDSCGIILSLQLNGCKVLALASLNGEPALSIYYSIDSNSNICAMLTRHNSGLLDAKSLHIENQLIAVGTYIKSTKTRICVEIHL